MSGFFSILASNLVCCVLRVAASLIRTSSHYVHHVQKPRVFAFSWSNTLALGSCLIASKDKAITKATTSGSAITEPTTQASASSASSASLRPFGVTCISPAPCVQPSHFKLPHKSLRLCGSAGNNNIRMNITCSSLLISKTPNLPVANLLLGSGNKMLFRYQLFSIP